MNNFLRYFLFLSIILTIFSRCSENSPPYPDPDPEPEVPEEPGDFTITPHDFLSDEKYDFFVTEVVYVDGYKPDQNSSAGLISFLDGRIHKSAGIRSYGSVAIASPGKSSYSIDDLKELEKAYRTKLPSDTLLSAWIFIVDGDFSGNEDDSKVLGVAYGETSIALFGKTIADYSGGIDQPSKQVLETTVLQHEFCHLLGLVNNGTPMIDNHQDTEHGHHCSNNNCLMYYAAETNHFLTDFLWGSPPPLKDQCLNDLQNNGGK